MSEVKLNNTHITGESQPNNNQKIDKNPYFSKSRKKRTNTKNLSIRELKFNKKYPALSMGNGGYNIKPYQQEFLANYQILMSHTLGLITIRAKNSESKKNLDKVVKVIQNRISELIKKTKKVTSKVYLKFTIPSDFSGLVLKYYTFQNIYEESDTYAYQGDVKDELTEIHISSKSDNTQDIKLCFEKLKLQTLTICIEDLKSIGDLVLKNAFCYGIKEEMDETIVPTMVSLSSGNRSLYQKLEKIIPKIFNSKKSYRETEFQDKDHFISDDWNKSITNFISDDYHSFIGDKNEYFAVKDVMNPTFEKYKSNSKTYKYVPSECMYLQRGSSLSEWKTKKNPYGLIHNHNCHTPPKLLTKYKGFSDNGEVESGLANGHWVIPSERFSYERVSKYCYAENYFGGLGGNYMEYLAAIYMNENSEKIRCPACNKKGTIKHNGGIYTSHQDFICTKCSACYELKAKSNYVCKRLIDSRNSIYDLSVYGGSYSSFEEQKNKGKDHYILLMECGNLLNISHNESESVYSCLFEPNISLKIYCGRIHQCIPRISEKTIAQVNSGCDNPSIKCKYYFSKLKHWITVEVPPEVKNYQSFKNTIMESEFGSSARKIQKLCRKHLEKNRNRKTKAVLVIQKLCRKHLEKKTKAIRVIQKLYKNRRNVRVKSANVLQKFWRKYLKNKPFDWGKWSMRGLALRTEG